MKTRHTRVRWLMGAALLAALIYGPGLVQLIRLRISGWRLDQQLAELHQRKQQLAHEQDRLEHDDTYVEGLVRSTFKVAKPGELVLPLTDDASTDPSTR